MAFAFDVTAEDLKVFLDEAEEQLQLMEEDFVRLEKEADSQDLLQEIFRAAHTLKGSSATLGHRAMAEVTHGMENVLDKLRKGKLTVSTALMDTLFACLDVLKTFKEEIANGDETTVDTQIVLARLASVDTGAAAEAAAAVMPAAPATQLAIPALTAEEEGKLSAGHSAGFTPYWIVLAFDPNGPMPAVRAFQALLAVQEAGQLVRSWPTQEEVEQDKVEADLRILLLTKEGADRLRQLLSEVPEAQVAELSVVPAHAAADLDADHDEAGLEPAHKANGAKGGGRRPVSGRTVRVDVDVLDNLMNLVGELVIDRTRLSQIIGILEGDRTGDEVSQELGRASAHIGRVTSELQEEIMRARMLPVDNLFKKFPRMVRDSAQALNKEINFIIRGEDTELDRSVIEEIGDPLMHLLRNAVDHGIEPPMERLKAGKPSQGTVILEASHEENHIIIDVRDDGRGIDPAKLRASAVKKGLLTDEAARRLSDAEAIRLIFAAGFSTKEQVSDLSGRGVGMDVVHKNIEKLNGAVDVKTEVGKGAEFRIKLPLTLAIIRALLVDLLGTTYCIPLNSVTETIRIEEHEVQAVRGREVYVYRGSVVPLLRLDQAFELERSADSPGSGELFVVIVNLFGKQVGIVVDSLIGEQDVVIKSLGKFIGEVPGISGATILGDGNVAIILDVASLINSVTAAAQ